MKRYFCEKCNGILPKGKMVCIQCGYENPELIPEFSYRLKRRIVIRRITKIAAIVGIIAIMHANFLFPWQWRTLNNKAAMVLYAKENYPGAKIVDQHYETAEFNPWAISRDYITIKWNDLEFGLSTEDGRYISDGYWMGVAHKAVYDAFLSPFFEQRNIKFDCDIQASKLAAYLRDNPGSDITGFDDWGTRIVIFPKYVRGKKMPRDLGWLYDFYRYCKENISLSSYKVTLVYPPEDKGSWFIHIEEDSEYNSEEEFYSAFFNSGSRY